MTRQAARSGFVRFVEDALDYTEREFSVARALQSDATGAGGKVVDRLLSDSETVREQVVEPELTAYREQVVSQFDILLDAIESGEDIETYRAAVLDADAYDANLRSDLSPERRSELRDRLFERQRGLATAVAPLVEAPEDDFWAAAETAFDREAMTRLVADHFAFTGPMQEHRGAFRMATQIDPGEVLGGGFLVSRLPTIDVEYTDEALRSMRRAERRVIRETKAEIEERY
ncbi:hypothetical protein [Natronomonas marina]|uniref:hypothetical protein n=1 Tax=Natronomonas marina TaxID=2961939 RepID=UPI0020C96966|nr:hypothetical protein [Natronomonas marina]